MKSLKFTTLFWRIYALVLAAMFVGSASAENMTEAWVRRGIFTPTPSAVAVDTDGTLFVVGGTSDYMTVAYSPEGVLLWTNIYKGPWSTDAATAVAVGSDGTVFVTGDSHGGSPNYLDYSTIAYSHEGLPLWTNRYNGPGNVADTPAAIAVGHNGDVFVTGGSATIGYSLDGVPLWTNAYAGSGYNFGGRALAVSAGGTVIVAGKGNGYTTIAYSQGGIPLWTNSYGAGHEVTAMAVATDGAVFVTGYAYGSGGYFDYATIAYSHIGVALWTNRYSGLFSNSDDRATALALGTNGTVFVTGYSGASSGPDYATIAYSHEGIPLWTNRYNGTANAHDYAHSVAVDASGHVFVTGDSFGSGSSGDFATITYSHEGMPLSTNRYNSPSNYYDGVGSFAIVPDGVVVVGYSITSRFGRDGTVVKYITSPPGYNTLSGLLTEDGAMRLSYMGLPSTSYALERTFNLAPPDWAPQITNTADAAGAIVFTNAPDSTTNNFWRVRSVP